MNIVDVNRGGVHYVFERIREMRLIVVASFGSCGGNVGASLQQADGFLSAVDAVKLFVGQAGGGFEMALHGAF